MTFTPSVVATSSVVVVVATSTTADIFSNAAGKKVGVASRIIILLKYSIFKITIIKQKWVHSLVYYAYC